MRRWISATVCVAVMVLVGGCHTVPPGVDGQLTDEWTMIGEAKQTVPEAGDCQPHGAVADTVSMIGYEPIECTRSHAAETVHVGTFTGAAAAKTAPPEDRSAELKLANQECDRKSKEYLGGDWLGAWLRMDLVFPTTKAWSGGARWFRCDALELNASDGTSLVTRTASLKNALKAASALQLGCFQYTSGAEKDLVPTGCTKPHNTEFAGVLPGGETPYPGAKADKGKAYYVVGCQIVIAAFLKVTPDRLTRVNLGMVWTPAGEADWANGRRGVQCFVWFSDSKISKSVRGTGTSLFPK